MSLHKKWTLGRILAAAAATAILLAVGAEAAARLSGAVDFPLYRADNQIGYIPAPSQHGSFLNKNPWRFNALSMGAREFDPSPTDFDLLVVGDSVVLGGNPYREEDRLGPQLERQLKTPVWPISAGSWALQNELTYLRQHPDVVRQVDAIAIVSNVGDFDQPSSWACDLTHPLQRPVSAAVYLFRKYVHGTCDGVRPDMKVPDGDWKTSLREFLASPSAQGKPVIFFLYPDHKEAGNTALLASELEVHAAELKAQGVQQIVSVGRDQRWKNSYYRDDIHPNVEGTRVLAEIISKPVKAIASSAQRQ